MIGWLSEWVNDWLKDYVIKSDRVRQNELGSECESEIDREREREREREKTSFYFFESYISFIDLKHSFGVVHERTTHPHVLQLVN